MYGSCTIKVIFKKLEANGFYLASVEYGDVKLQGYLSM
jgi:hypothetical protein